jgi:TPR repeat protein
MCSLSRVLLSLLWALLLLVGITGAGVANACHPNLSPAEHIRCLCDEAEHGDMLSQYLLGSAYFVGIETPRDYEQAAKWYRRAADQGHPGAQFRLGSMYYLGQGVPKSIVLSEMWFILSAVQGSDYARQVRDTTEQEMTTGADSRSAKVGA